MTAVTMRHNGCTGRMFSIGGLRSLTFVRLHRQLCKTGCYLSARSDASYGRTARTIGVEIIIQDTIIFLTDASTQAYLPLVSCTPLHTQCFLSKSCTHVLFIQANQQLQLIILLGVRKVNSTAKCETSRFYDNYSFHKR